MTTETLTTGIAELSDAELEVIAVKGEATGKISGINHMMLVTRDFERSLLFYRDILGFRLISHTGGRAHDPNDRIVGFAYDSISFFRVADNIVFGLYEHRHAALQANASTTIDNWPERDRHFAPPAPHGLDHISFDVPTWKDVLWFHDQLERHGVPVSVVYDFGDGTAGKLFDKMNGPPFAAEHTGTPWLRDTRDNVLSGSVYFYDPDGNALEVSSRDWTRDYPVDNAMFAPTRRG